MSGDQRAYLSSPPMIPTHDLDYPRADREHTLERISTLERIESIPELLVDVTVSASRKSGMSS